ncbi:hypothetical protein [Clostridium polynesiense]|uniref:hypothetical protein n=1 Tax=Clostridium polynesiense TaxID=1325933 RepID=UPI00058FD615|nr:hypothetical protein [Clostridium polynesiense]
MFNNVYEAILKGSDTIFLQVPEADFNFNYDHISIRNSQDFADNYFAVKSKDGIPHVKNAYLNESTHMVVIAVQVDYNVQLYRNNYTVPDTIPNNNISCQAENFE